MQNFHMSGRQFTDLENFWVILNVEKKDIVWHFFHEAYVQSYET